MLFFVLLVKNRRAMPLRIEATSEAEAKAIALDQHPDALFHSVRPM